MKKEYKIAILVFVGALALLVIGYQLAMNNQEKTEPKSSTAVIKQDTEVQLESDKYSTINPKAKTDFVDGCAVDGTTKASCVCMYDWLDNNLTNAQFTTVILEAVEGKVSDHIWSAAKACVTI